MIVYGKLALFVGAIVLTIAAWWFWPIAAFIRAKRRHSPCPALTSTMLQFAGVSALWGWVLLGPYGAITGFIFPPIWPLSAHFLAQEAQQAHLPVSVLIWPAAGAVTLSGFLCVAMRGPKLRVLLHSVIWLPACFATFVGLWMMDESVQTKIEHRAAELSATCLKTAPLTNALNRLQEGPLRRHALAIVDGQYVAWSHKKNDFYTINIGLAPRDSADCLSL